MQFPCFYKILSLIVHIYRLYILHIVLDSSGNANKKKAIVLKSIDMIENNDTKGN